MPCVEKASWPRTIAYETDPILAIKRTHQYGYLPSAASESPSKCRSSDRTSDVKSE